MTPDRHQVLVSIHLNRTGEQVAKWVYDIASRRSDAEYELVDRATTRCRTWTSRGAPSFGQYENEQQ